jgi:hypothetical protein
LPFRMSFTVITGAIAPVHHRYASATAESLNDRRLIRETVRAMVKVMLLSSYGRAFRAYYAVQVMNMFKS